MARYLLGTQCLVDIARRQNLPPERWLAGLDAPDTTREDVHISAVTPMILTSTFDGAPKTPFNDGLRQSCETLVRRFVLAGQVVPITKDIADLWGRLLEFELTYTLPDGETRSYDFRERLVMATAIEGIAGLPFVLVDRQQAAHLALVPLGLQLEDPYGAR